MKRNRCFWCMQALWCTCVSTCAHMPFLQRGWNSTETHPLFVSVEVLLHSELSINISIKILEFPRSSWAVVIDDLPRSSNTGFLLHEMTETTVTANLHV